MHQIYFFHNTIKTDFKWRLDYKKRVVVGIDEGINVTNYLYLFTFLLSKKGLEFRYLLIHIKMLSPCNSSSVYQFTSHSLETTCLDVYLDEHNSVIHTAKRLKKCGFLFFISLAV